MALKVTVKWSTQKLSWKDPWRASLQLDVTGTTDPTVALAAVDADNPAIFVWQKNAACPLPGSSRLKCVGPEIAEKKGPGYFVIQCDFELPPVGVFPQRPDNPLDEPAKIRWELVEMSEPVDIDIDGLVICATNGESFSGANRPITFYRLVIVKNFPYFDFSLSQTYSNTTNDAALSLAGIPVAEEHMRCSSIIPAAEYAADAEYVPMAFYFEIFFDDALGLYPFQHRFLNQGTYGHWDDGGTIRRSDFSDGVAHTPDGKGQPIGRPVRLGLTGLPIGPDASLKVGPDNKTPVALAAVPDSYQTEALTDAFAIYFKRVKRVSFTPLLAIF